MEDKVSGLTTKQAKQWKRMIKALDAFVEKGPSATPKEPFRLAGKPFIGSTAVVAASGDAFIAAWVGYGKYEVVAKEQFPTCLRMHKFNPPRRECVLAEEERVTLKVAELQGRLEDNARSKKGFGCMTFTNLAKDNDGKRQCLILSTTQVARLVAAAKALREDRVTLHAIEEEKHARYVFTKLWLNVGPMTACLITHVITL